MLEQTVTWENDAELRAHCDRFALNQLNRLYDAISQHPKMLKQPTPQPSEPPVEAQRTSAVAADSKPSEPSINEMALAALAQSNCAWSRFVALMHLQMPASSLATAALSELWWERYAIAHNPNTPGEQIQALHQDHNCLVRAAARVHSPD